MSLPDSKNIKSLLFKRILTFALCLSFFAPSVFILNWNKTENLFGVKDIYNDHGHSILISKKIGEQVDIREKIKTIYFFREKKGHILPLIYLALSVSKIKKLQFQNMFLFFAMQFLLLISVLLVMDQRRREVLLVFLGLVFSMPIFLQESTHVDSYFLIYSMMFSGLVFLNGNTDFSRSIMFIFLFSLAGMIKPIEVTFVLSVLAYQKSLLKKSIFFYLFIVFLYSLWWAPFFLEYLNHVFYRVNREVILSPYGFWSLIRPFLSFTLPFFIVLTLKYRGYRKVVRLNLFVGSIVLLGISNFQYVYIFCFLILIDLAFNELETQSRLTILYGLATVFLQWCFNLFVFSGILSFLNPLNLKPIHESVWKNTFRQLQIGRGSGVLRITNSSSVKRWQINLFQSYLEQYLMENVSRWNLQRKEEQNLVLFVITDNSKIVSERIPKTTKITFDKSMWLCNYLVLCDNPQDFAVSLSINELDSK